MQYPEQRTTIKSSTRVLPRQANTALECLPPAAEVEERIFTTFPFPCLLGVRKGLEAAAPFLAGGLVLEDKS